MTHHRTPEDPSEMTTTSGLSEVSATSGLSKSLEPEGPSVSTDRLRLEPPTLETLWLSSPRSGDVSEQGEARQRLHLGPILAKGKNLIQEAFDINLQRSVVLKKLRSEQMNNPAEVRRLIEEAQITAQLDHPTIVPVHELGFDNTSTLYFAMKHVQGKTLHDLLGQDHETPQTERTLFQWLQVFLRVCDAVDFAHSRGVIHRNIHPKNIMIGEYGQVYLMDWGLVQHKHETRPSEDHNIFPTDWEIARWMEEQQAVVDSAQIESSSELPAATASSASLDTISRAQAKLEALCYLAPEQTRMDRSRIDERTDVFALGAVLYHIITGFAPHQGNSLPVLLFKAAQCQVVSPQERVSYSLPPKLCQIAMKALSKESEQRYPSVAALKREVEHFLESGWQFPRRSYQSGDLVVREGDIGKEAYIIIKGHCRAFRTVQGEKQVLREMTEGDVFGETAVFTDQIRSASVEALDEVTLAVLSSRHFEEELGMGFWLGVFIKALAARFREKDARVLELEQQLAAGFTDQKDSRCK